MQEAFEQCGVGMFGYMTEIDSVDIIMTHDIEAEGDDIQGLLYHFLDELLFMFCAEPFLVAKVLPSKNLPNNCNWTHKKSCPSFKIFERGNYFSNKWSDKNIEF